ncbi:MAG TPA: hypothetical protein VHD87_06235 [Acidimicrobiales bacterium]|nr:hypothetical protein [Acidimicrobiales bacterium]
MNADVPPGLTVTEMLARYEEQGYVMSFGVEAEAKLRCGACRTVSDAQDVHVEGIARAEGPSDPADMAMVAVVRCPWCTVEGTLVVGYGPTASPEDADVVALLFDEREEGEPAVLFPDEEP